MYEEYHFTTFKPPTLSPSPKTSRLLNRIRWCHLGNKFKSYCQQAKGRNFNVSGIAVVSIYCTAISDNSCDSFFPARRPNAAFHCARKLVFTSFPVENIVPLKSEVVFPSGNSEFCILRAPRLSTQKYELGKTRFRAQWNAA